MLPKGLITEMLSALTVRAAIVIAFFSFGCEICLGWLLTTSTANKIVGYEIFYDPLTGTSVVFSSWLVQLLYEATYSRAFLALALGCWLALLFPLWDGLRGAPLASVRFFKMLFIFQATFLAIVLLVNLVFMLQPGLRWARLWIDFFIVPFDWDPVFPFRMFPVPVIAFLVLLPFVRKRVGWAGFAVALLLLPVVLAPIFLRNYLARNLLLTVLYDNYSTALQFLEPVLLLMPIYIGWRLRRKLLREDDVPHGNKLPASPLAG